jgi:hypothetical protein
MVQPEPTTNHRPSIRECLDAVQFAHVVGLHRVRAAEASSTITTDTSRGSFSSGWRRVDLAAWKVLVAKQHPLEGALQQWPAARNVARWIQRTAACDVDTDAVEAKKVGEYEQVAHGNLSTATHATGGTPPAVVARATPATTATTTASNGSRRTKNTRRTSTSTSTTTHCGSSGRKSAGGHAEQQAHTVEAYAVAHHRGSGRRSYRSAVNVAPGTRRHDLCVPLQHSAL